MTGENALKACPFCGEAARPIAYRLPYHSKYPGDWWQAHCSNGFLGRGPCTAKGPVAETAEKAIALWNTRSPVCEDARGELVEALEAMLEMHGSDQEEAAARNKARAALAKSLPSPPPAEK